VTRPVRAAAFGLGVLGLLVLVALAARGGHPSASGHVATRAVPNSVQDSFITLLTIAYVVGIVAIVITVFRRRRLFHEPESRWLKNFASVCLLMLIATAIGYYAITHRHQGHNGKTAQSQGQQGAGGTRGRSHIQPVPTRPAHFEWPVLAGVAGLVLLGGVYVYVRNRRRPADDGEPTLEADIAAALTATIDDLRNERDPRRAVIGAYAQMERALASHGLRRTPAEAPLEYLGRILLGMNVRDTAVQTLTALFEYAKFSRHEIDAAMKAEAIDALVAVRDDLEAEQELAA
jgi:Domain of unknown function (DUF4129)